MTEKDGEKDIADIIDGYKMDGGIIKECREGHTLEQRILAVMLRQTKELRTRNNELTEMWRNAEDDNIRQSRVIVELRTRVAELEKGWEVKYGVWLCPVCNSGTASGQLCQRCQGVKLQELQNRLSTLLKASEGMEKALEETILLAETDDEKFEISAKTNGDKLDQAKQILADFRALKETK